MRRLTPLDELLAHQVPEPITTPAIEHPYWRESYFFEAHGPGHDTDVIALGFANYPQRQAMDAVLLGRVGGKPLFGHVDRAWNGDAHTTKVGPVKVTIAEPFQRINIGIEGFEGFSCDLTFTARTQPYGLRRGRMVDDAGLLIWDQSHMIQSGLWSGTYSRDGEDHTVEHWVGQRDHSWGVRDHGRAPMWLWLAVQLPDGMLGAWHWEWRNGARIFTDGCWAPAGGGEIVPVIDVQHDLMWLDADGSETAWTGTGDNVDGLAGRVVFTLEGGRRIELTGRGTWAARYRPFYGGGQQLMTVTTDDGRSGTAIYELTGCHHHRYFPTGFASGDSAA